MAQIPPLTVACVLRSGGIYDESWVRRLARGVARHITVPHEFVCLTDTPLTGIRTIPLLHDWPRWWPKIELFRPGLLPPPVLYLDLDSIILGDVSRLVGGLNGFRIAPHKLDTDYWNSSVMAWNKDYSRIYRTFSKNPREAMRTFARHPRIGDQAFISRWLVQTNNRPQTFDSGVHSYKGHGLQNHPHPDTIVAIFHGKPKPPHITEGWVADEWAK